MKKSGGVRKSAGRPPGRKATAPVDVNESAVMTLREVADYLNCHYSTAHRLASQGKIPDFKLEGGNWRFLKSEPASGLQRAAGATWNRAGKKAYGRWRLQAQA